MGLLLQTLLHAQKRLDGVFIALEETPLAPSGGNCRPSQGQAETVDCDRSGLRSINPAQTPKSADALLGEMLLRLLQPRRIWRRIGLASALWMASMSMLFLLVDVRL
jgi:hypothetical protein